MILHMYFRSGSRRGNGRRTSRSCGRASSISLKSGYDFGCAWSRSFTWSVG